MLFNFMFLNLQHRLNNINNISLFKSWTFYIVICFLFNPPVWKCLLKFADKSNVNDTDHFSTWQIPFIRHYSVFFPCKELLLLIVSTPHSRLSHISALVRTPWFLFQGTLVLARLSARHPETTSLVMSLMRENSSAVAYLSLVSGSV